VLKGVENVLRCVLSEMKLREEMIAINMKRIRIIKTQDLILLCNKLKLDIKMACFLLLVALSEAQKGAFLLLLIDVVMLKHACSFHLNDKKELPVVIR
jgi:hypothetical protein